MDNNLEQLKDNIRNITTDDILKNTLLTTVDLAYKMGKLDAMQRMSNLILDLQTNTRENE